MASSAYNAASKRKHEAIEISDDEAASPVVVKPKKGKGKAKVVAPKTEIVQDSDFDESDIEFELEDPEVVEKAERGEIVEELPASTALLKVQRSVADITCPIFRHLCEKIFADGSYPHVIKYLDSQGVSAVFSYIQGLMKANPNLKQVVDKQLWHNVKALKSIDGGSTTTQSAGWYADIVTDEEDDQYVKVYVGQATRIRGRIAPHAAAIRKGKTSLHYTVLGAKPSRQAYFVVLGVKSNDSIVQWGVGLLDVVEMYFSLVLQTLPKKSLIKYLPAGATIREPEVGLQIATPLMQGSTGKGCGLHRLKDSTDPEVVKYYKEMQAASLAKAHAALKADGYRAISQGCRASGTNASKFGRPARPDRPEEVHVEIVCGKNHKKMDPDPLFRKSDGAYVRRAIFCAFCSSVTKSGKKKSANPMHHPTDTKLLRVSLAKIGSGIAYRADK